MYLGYMGWQMAAGDREWEITPMLKPILIGFTLVYWSGFVNLIQAPFEAIAEPGIAIFSDIESEVNDLRIQRFKKQQQLLDAVIKLKADEDAKQEVINNTGKERHKHVDGRLNKTGQITGNSFKHSDEELEQGVYNLRSILDQRLKNTCNKL